MRSRHYYLALLLALSLDISARMAWASNFYECTNSATGERRFTEGSLPEGEWKCQGFGMKHGGFAHSRNENPNAQQAAASKKAVTPPKGGMTMVDMVKRSWQQNNAGR